MVGPGAARAVGTRTAGAPVAVLFEGDRGQQQFLHDFWRAGGDAGVPAAPGAAAITPTTGTASSVAAPAAMQTEAGTALVPGGERPAGGESGRSGSEISSEGPGRPLPEGPAVPLPAVEGREDRLAAGRAGGAAAAAAPAPGMPVVPAFPPGGPPPASLGRCTAGTGRLVERRPRRAGRRRRAAGAARTAIRPRRGRDFPRAVAAQKEVIRPARIAPVEGCGPDSRWRFGLVHDFSTRTQRNSSSGAHDGGVQLLLGWEICACPW